MESGFDDLDYDYAASVAGRAVRSMAEQRIPPTPTNFAVWFHYFAGSHDDLRNAIDLLIDHNRPFDARTNQDLFDREFPGHYLRLIRRVKVSMPALLPAGRGIRATLSASGVSRTVVARGPFDTVSLRRDLQGIARTAVAVRR